MTQQYKQNHKIYDLQNKHFTDTFLSSDFRVIVWFAERCDANLADEPRKLLPEDMLALTSGVC